MEHYEEKCSTILCYTNVYWQAKAWISKQMPDVVVKTCIFAKQYSSAAATAKLQKLNFKLMAYYYNPNLAPSDLIVTFLYIQRVIYLIERSGAFLARSSTDSFFFFEGIIGLVQRWSIINFLIIIKFCNYIPDNN